MPATTVAQALLVMGGEDCQRWPRSSAALRYYWACRDAGQPLPHLIVTGGAPVQLRGRRTTEATLMAEFLEAHGVPAAHVLRETLARDTLGNVVLGGALALSHGMAAQRVALVSDNFHLPRCLRLFSRVFGHAPLSCIGSGVSGTLWLRWREHWAERWQLRALQRAGITAGHWQAHFEFLNVSIHAPFRANLEEVTPSPK